VPACRGAVGDVRETLSGRGSLRRSHLALLSHARFAADHLAGVADTQDDDVQLISDAFECDVL
jgi:hypothetical protein